MNRRSFFNKCGAFVVGCYLSLKVELNLTPEDNYAWWLRPADEWYLDPEFKEVWSKLFAKVTWTPNMGETLRGVRKDF